MKRIAALLLVLCAILPQLALGAGFTDVPENSWAPADIAAANETGIMDSRSISDKIGLAKMFGVNNISVWRLGAIPDGAGDTYMNVWETLSGR